MSVFLSAALELASKNLPVFPLVPRSKEPAIKKYTERATTDKQAIEQWWRSNPEFNIGISTERLLAVDVDNKGTKKGDEQLLRLELEGNVFPDTFEQITPTGGRHLIFQVPIPVKQGVDVLGPGLDIRARGGYVVGAGSRLDSGTYRAIERPLQPAPVWLVERCGTARQRNKKTAEQQLTGIEPSRAADRAAFYLINEAPLAVEGAAGDQTTYLVACRAKDFGVVEPVCVSLMLEHWNHRCSPPWDAMELAKKVANAYEYGESAVGVGAPEAAFPPLSQAEKPALHPFEKLNQEYAYVIGEGSDHVIHETVDAEGQFHLKHLDIDAFHRSLGALMMNFGGKTQPTSKLWIASDQRRTYQGICFLPGKEAPKKFYNLWRGFTVKPATEQGSRLAQKSLEDWREHLFENVCDKEEALANWLTGYFAHLVQKPHEKPLVALVLKGGKGVGKNALIERVGYLLGNHAATISNRRYLTGNFNSVLENKLLLTLDEAFWSGDKAAEGVLKDLITGEYHTIERKGREPYRVRNCLRVAILGNEDWLAPASEDERRFAVFNVGDGRKQDNTFFRQMRERMEEGGYSLLLRYLQNFDLRSVDVTRAPSTKGLLEQKVSTLVPFSAWWKDCLAEGRLVGSDFEGWTTEISVDRFRSAFQRYVRERNIGGRLPTGEMIGKDMRKFTGRSISGRKRVEGILTHVYRLPELLEARRLWDKFIGHFTVWEPIAEEEEVLS